MARNSLFDARLYGIVDLGYVDPGSLSVAAQELIAGGIDVIQLRAKGHPINDVEEWARELVPICRDGGVPFVVNDHAEIARDVGADGVHVGQDDASMAEVRRIVGDTMLVGRSTHSVEQARAAAADPQTDCIGFGPLFATPTKPTYKPIGTEEIRAVHAEHVDLPIFCIGGIKLENLPSVIAAGARRVVIVSGLLCAESRVETTREAKRLLTETG
ncbi:MAG: thiamine phosphate synthase [Verrucomicrobiota bacterium]